MGSIITAIRDEREERMLIEGAQDLSEEVRIKDPKTGGEKGAKIQRYSLIPWEFLSALATHYGIGARKYEDRNWERGYKWSLSLDAFYRHLNDGFLKGERYDKETGTHHLICAIWHLIALYCYDVWGKGTNDISPHLPPLKTEVDVKSYWIYPAEKGYGSGV